MSISFLSTSLALTPMARARSATVITSEMRITRLRGARRRDLGLLLLLARLDARFCGRACRVRRSRAPTCRRCRFSMTFLPFFRFGASAHQASPPGAGAAAPPGARPPAVARGGGRPSAGRSARAPSAPSASKRRRAPGPAWARARGTPGRRGGARAGRRRRTGAGGGAAARPAAGAARVSARRGASRPASAAARASTGGGGLTRSRRSVKAAEIVGQRSAGLVEVERRRDRVRSSPGTAAKGRHRSGPELGHARVVGAGSCRHEPRLVVCSTRDLASACSPARSTTRSVTTRHRGVRPRRRAHDVAAHDLLARRALCVACPSTELLGRRDRSFGSMPHSLASSWMRFDIVPARRARAEISARASRAAPVPPPQRPHRSAPRDEPLQQQAGSCR